MGVSENRGTPKSSILIEFSIINHPFWGIPIFGNTQIDKFGILTSKRLGRMKSFAVTADDFMMNIIISGQIIVFHQPRFPWNKRISRTKPTIWSEVVWGRYNLTKYWPDNIYLFICSASSKGAFTLGSPRNTQFFSLKIRSELAFFQRPRGTRQY